VKILLKCDSRQYRGITFFRGTLYSWSTKYQQKGAKFNKKYHQKSTANRTQRRWFITSYDTETAQAGKRLNPAGVLQL